MLSARMLKTNGGHWYCICVTISGSCCCIFSRLDQLAILHVHFLCACSIFLQCCWLYRLLLFALPLTLWDCINPLVGTKYGPPDSCVLFLNFISCCQLCEYSIHCCHCWSKIYDASSISLRFTLFFLLYPAAPEVCSSLSWSRYSSWKCVLKCTHMRSLTKINFHMQYAWMYYSVAIIWSVLMSESWRSVKVEFTTIANSFPTSIWLKIISTGSSILYIDCIVPWLFMISLGMTFPYLM